jgi:hypothetical protein
MFASIRRYRLDSGSMDDLTRRVDEGFADQIAEQPGFVSYEFLDCGDSQVMTISVFRDADGAEASRDLAQRWSEEELGDFDFTRTEALRGEILVSRAAQGILEPSHAGTERKFASVRRYALRGGSIGDVMHIVDETFAEEIQQTAGFMAYHALDCGDGMIMSMSLFSDRSAVQESDELAGRFVREKLTDFDIERTEALGGEIVVSRARAEVLEPAHA